jgi:hypothetical protein
MMNENPDKLQHQPGGSLTSTPPPTGSRVGETIDDVTATIRDFVNKVPETINKTVERVLNVRDTTVLVRLSEGSSDALDTLVTAGIFRNRAEAAAFLIDEGIKMQAPLFQRIQSKLSEIERLRDELRHSVSPESQK